VQRFLTHKAESYLQQKLKTKVKIGEINLVFPKSIYLGDIYIESLEKDTLLFSHSIKVDMDMLGLLHNRARINSLKIDRLTAHVKRRLSDSSFNFSFILKAFAGDTTKKAAQKDTEKKPFEFSIYGISLHDLYLTYNDEVSGIDALTRLGKLDIDIRKFDLEKQKIDIRGINFENTLANVLIYKPSPPDTTASKPIRFIINTDLVKMAGIKVNFKNKVGRQTFTTDLGTLNLKNTHVDMGAQKIDIRDIDLYQTFAGVSINENAAPAAQLKKNGQKAIARADTAVKTKAPGWAIALNKITMNATAFNYSNNEAKPVQRGIDYNYLSLRSLNLDCRDITWKASRTSADLRQLGFKDKSGFSLTSMRSKILFDSVETIISDLDINTGSSHITRYAALHYTSLDELSDHTGDVLVNADLNESIIGYRDILYFAPALEKTAPFSKDPDGSARLASIVDGRIGDLNIKSLFFTAGSGTVLQAHGNVKNLPDMNKAYFNISFTQLNTNNRDVIYFSPAGAIPRSISIPQRISTKGYFRGTISEFSALLNAATSSGDATVNLHLKMAKNTKYSAYIAHVTTNSLQLGRILNQQGTLGPLTMYADINGTGFQLQDINASITAHADKATLMKYPYRNFSVDGRFSNEAFNGNAEMKDSNMEFKFKGLIGVNADSQIYKFNLNIIGADLQAVHLMDSDFRVKAVLNADITGNKLNDLNGTASLNNVLILKKGKSYPVKSFAFFSATSGDNDSITIRSDFMNADFTGTIQPMELPEVLKDHLNKYFGLPGNPTVENYEIQKFRFRMEIGRTDLITDVFYPKIQKLVTGPISGDYNSKTKVIHLDADIPEIEYSGTTIDTFKLKVVSDPDKMDYSLTTLSIKNNVEIRNLSLDGKIENDSINTRVSVKNDSGKTKFMIAAGLRSYVDFIRVNIKQNGVIFNYKPWEVSKDNYITTGKEIYVHDLVLSTKKGSLTVNSPGEAGSGSPMIVDFKNFDLGAATSWLQKDTNFVDGIANGKVELHDLTGNMQFKSDLTVDNLTYKNDTLGNVKLIANNTENSRYNAEIIVSGNNNDLNVIGFYANEAKVPNFSFKTDIRKLNLSTVNVFTKGQLSEMSGYMQGKLLFSGTAEMPEITGNLHFHEAGFTLDYLSTHYTLHNEELAFNTKNIAFNNFTISDSADNKAIVNGHIYTKYFSNFQYDLKAKTNHFLALNSKGKKGDLYFGKVLVTSTSTIKGTLKAPVVDVTAHLENGTFMTVVIPQDEPSIEERKGVVYFVAQHRPPDKVLYRRKKFDTTREESIKGLEFTSNIEVDKDARLKIIVDQDAGDYLDVKGAGTLSYGMRSDGTSTLTGRYEILEGSYQLTFYDFVKRRFTIQQGGSITWLGTPMNAEIDLTAMYETRTAPLPLVDAELSGLSESDRNRYRQQLRFQVLLKMSGALKKPDINMDISMNDLDKGAFNGEIMERITELEQDKSDLNKQVFALLVLNRFIEENPFTAQENIPATIAYGSVSELITQQLNAVASRYLKRGHLSFDVRSYEDYSTGVSVRSSEFKATLQEQFLDDRLTINLGSDLNVQGTGADNLHPEANTNQAVSDVSIEYMLTKDGRYRVLVFRDNTYAGIIEGRLVETGAGFVFVRDFNTFNKLFTKPKNATGAQTISPAKKPGQ
jgi:translocation and assembly module TamB